MILSAALYALFVSPREFRLVLRGDRIERQLVRRGKQNVSTINIMTMIVPWHIPLQALAIATRLMITIRLAESITFIPNLGHNMETSLTKRTMVYMTTLLYGLFLAPLGISSPLVRLIRRVNHGALFRKLSLVRKRRLALLSILITPTLRKRPMDWDALSIRPWKSLARDWARPTNLSKRIARQTRSNAHLRALLRRAEVPLITIMQQIVTITREVDIVQRIILPRILVAMVRLYRTRTPIRPPFGKDMNIRTRK